jgi:hypothetical protein
MPKSFEQGNQLWKLRSKHGVDALFTEPEKLWQSACEYFEWTDNHPEISIDFRGKDAVEVELPKKQPYTMQGLCIYLGVNTAYFRNFKGSETFKNNDFNTIYTRIEETIYNQKFSGAASGFFNANIIARDLGLVDQKHFDAMIDDRRKSLDELFPPLDEIENATGDQ